MALVWKCSCGAESARDHPLELTLHVKRGRDKGEAHNGIGLVDTETGEVLELTLVWKCSCGAEFAPKHALKLTSHVKQGREKGETHKGIGLVDAETGEVLAIVLRTATSLGLIPYSEEWRKKHSEYVDPTITQAPPAGQKNGDKPPTGAEPPVVTASLRGRFVTQEVLLDGRLLLLYDIARQCFPEYQATIGEWMLEIILRYYLEHTEDLRFGQLFADVVTVEA